MSAYMVEDAQLSIIAHALVVSGLSVDVKETFKELHIKNQESLAARYGDAIEKVDMNCYVDCSSYAVPLDLVFGLVRNYVYQACETNVWPDTKISRALQALEIIIIDKYRFKQRETGVTLVIDRDGYSNVIDCDNYSWGINSEAELVKALENIKRVELHPLLDLGIFPEPAPVVKAKRVERKNKKAATKKKAVAKKAKTKTMAATKSSKAHELAISNATFLNSFAASIAK